MHTKLAVLFLKDTISIRELIQECEELRFYTARYNARLAVCWDDFADALLRQATGEGASVLVKSAHVGAYCRARAEVIIKGYPEEVSQHIDKDALVFTLVDCVNMRLLEYPEPICGITEEYWGFI